MLGTSTTFEADVDRYAGAAPLNGGAAVASRHSIHPDNPRCVQALLDDLRAIGYCATTQAFSHGGKTLHNVIADLPGTGFYRIPKIILELREVLRHWPPDSPWEKIRELLGDSFAKELRLERRLPWEAKQVLLDLAGLEPWINWRLRRCPLPGPGAELVLIGCHLDSTAAATPATTPLPAVRAAPTTMPPGSPPSSPRLVSSGNSAASSGTPSASASSMPLTAFETAAVIAFDPRSTATWSESELVVLGVAKPPS